MKAEIAHRVHSLHSPHPTSAYTFSSPNTSALLSFASFSFGVGGVSVSTAEADPTDLSACAPVVQGSPIPTIEYGQRRGTSPLRQRRRSALYPEVLWGPSLTLRAAQVCGLFFAYQNLDNAARIAQQEVASFQSARID
jgi:hypothetical protein